MKDTYDFIIKLRAIREYRSDVLSKDDLSAILEAGRWTGSSKNNQDWSFVAVTEPDRLQELAKFGSYTKPVKNSAATVVLVQEKGGNMFDIGRAAQNMMLAAKAIGVASCPITLHRNEKVESFLGAPKGSIARYAVALGYPAEDAEPRKSGGRKDFAKVIKLDRY